MSAPRGRLAVLVRGFALSLALPALLAVVLATRDPVPEWTASAVLGAWIGCAAGLVAWSALGTGGGRRARGNRP